MASPDDLAEKIANKVADTLDPLAREMLIMRWPPEFRKIMLDAVAHHAAILAAEVRVTER